MKRELVALAVFFLSGTSGALCQQTADESTAFNPLGRELPIQEMDKQIRLQVEWIEVSHETYTELMAEDDPEHPATHRSGNDGPLRARLAELAGRGEAEILDTAMVICRSGQRAKVESIHEYIYPTEYDHPEIVRTNSDPEGKKQTNTVKESAPLPIPAAFETRNVGTTLEVDPVIGADDVTIDLNLAPEIVYLAGESEWGEFENREGSVPVKMPIFFTMKVTTQLVTIAGQYALISANSPMNEDTGLPDRGRKVFVLVKADLVLPGLPPEREPKPAGSKEKAKATSDKPAPKPKAKPESTPRATVRF
ncbi:MAG: hypothetical protein KDM91_14080 [Verrucomicrobiae bacterium]|nr:hypothetical protein [Verrucomicrobiae bacterium]MCP5539613.1 hypothetical protein [Akkermansiaceae bacterium]MCP5549351.1 hypothetical protein [Akkermansiaceae bacterium]